MTNWSLRAIVPEDNPLIADIIRTVLPSFGGGGEGFAVHDPEVDAMYEAYQQPQSCYYVAELHGEVIGGGGIAPLKGADVFICEMQKFYLLEKSRGFGIGKALLARCLEDAQVFGYKRCYIETLKGMDAAVALYIKYGFEELPAPLGSTGHFGCNKWMIKAL